MRSSDYIKGFFFFFTLLAIGMTKYYDRVTQRGCGISILEDTRNLSDKALSNAI